MSLYLRTQGYGNRKVDDVVYGDAAISFTLEDWRELAMAALDQAGYTASQQDRVRKLLGMEGP